MKTAEGVLKDQVKAYLKGRGIASISRPDPYAVGYYHMKVPNGYGEPTLDFHGCYKGRFFAIETKAPGKSMSARQVIIANALRKARACVMEDDTWETLQLKMQSFFDTCDAGVFGANGL